MKATGHCQCGAVSFTVDGEVQRMGHCHCEDCRRSTGTGHNVQAFFLKADVTITGATSTYESPADSGSMRTRHFCPVCGSRLFSENTRAPDTIGISAGAFDDNSWFRPDFIVYGHMRPAWDMIDPEIPQK